MSLLLRGRVLTPLREIEAGWVLVRDGLVAELGAGTPPAAGAVAGGPHHVVAPGLIDLQVNGYAGRDAAEGTEAMAEIASRLPSTGVTAFLATVITAPLGDMLRACDAAREVNACGARVLGVHMEGPYLNPAKKGAHDAALIERPTAAGARRMVAAGPRLVTLAPEMPGAADAITELANAGIVVSAGHSTATYDVARAGVRAGIRFATHLFNAMGTWGHREPGLAGAVLTDPGVTAGLISDGVHLHLAAVEAAIRLKGPGRVALTTDMVAAAGSPPGRYRLGDREVVSDGRRVSLVEDGTLAGGAGTMDGLVRITAGLPGVGLRRAVEMATLTPARVVGEDRMGRIEPGLPADLVLLDPELQVQLTLVRGEVAYE